MHREDDFVSVAVFNGHFAVRREYEFVTEFAPVALHIHELAAFLDAAVVNVIGIALIFAVRHTHKAVPVVSADERVARHLCRQPLAFRLRLIFFVDERLRRFLRNEIISALRPCPVFYVVADGNDVIFLPFDDGYAMPVLVALDMHDGQSPRRFRPVPFFLHFFLLLFRFFFHRADTGDKPVQYRGMGRHFKLPAMFHIFPDRNGFCPSLCFGRKPSVPIMALHGACQHIPDALHAELFHKLSFKPLVQPIPVEVLIYRLLYLVSALDIRLQRASV